MTKKSIFFEKIRKKSEFHGDDSQSKISQSVTLKKQIISAKLHQDNAENNSDVNHDSGYTFDSQDTISDDEMHSNPFIDHTSENKAVEETVTLSASFLVGEDFWNAEGYSESELFRFRFGFFQQSSFMSCQKGQFV